MNDARETEALWWRRGVIYQVYPRSFRDTNGDGVGDLRGIIAGLDYLAWLGVDAIWISPVYPSPMADFGYDVADYKGIDPLFGDLATFDELVAEAHRRDLRIVMDYVPNHSSDQHPWFVESRASRRNPKRDFYVWADPRPDGAPPNNWLSVFGGSAWTLDPATGQYYLHSFLKEQPDLNWRNPELRAAMLDVLRFWLDHGVDGFRIDVASYVMKDPQLRDNPPRPAGLQFHRSMGAYDSQQHLYDKAHPDVHDVFRDIRRLLNAYSTERPRMCVGEIHEFEWKQWARFYGTALDELHMPFNFGLLGAPWAGRAIRELVDSVNGAVPEGAWPNYVLGNHDEPRIASRVGQAQARVAMMLLLTLRGTPTLYYGDEFGMENVAIPPERERDPWGKLTPGLGLGRDPERTPMQWDDSPNAGFCPPGVEPWLPLAPDWRSRSVAAQRSEGRSMLAFTRALLAYRRASPALHSGSYQPVEGAPGDCFVYLRQQGAQRQLVALSFANEPREVSLPALGKGRVAISTELDREEPVSLAALRLRAHEGCVIELAE